ncbi:MAG TPA: alpha-amylase family glycosyl hydrolase [Verrucomicrobiota bacterium]|nr:alpha-amylase family glycosyl hydrolase [Verrucomicrobiota bacterium]
MRLLIRLALVAVIAPIPLLAQPSVSKVEPPSWWPGHSLNPIRLLIRGNDLAGARLEGVRGVRVSNVSVNAAGTYAFADVRISSGARPGPRELTLITPSGRAMVSFEILAPLPPSGRFQGFGPDDFIYFIMPDRFANGDGANDQPVKSPGLLDRSKPRYYHGGDLRGVIQRLPYLKELGVTTVWLTPWYDNNDSLNELEKYTLENKLDPVGGLPITDYHGYGAVDFYGVDEHLGDLATLRELVNTAHTLGLKIVQDQVANHVGPYHPWVTNPPTATWFHGTVADHPQNTWQTWTIPDPHAAPELRHSTLDGWFINILPDLNQDDAECRRYLIQNALWWVGLTGLDGIRQDTLPYVPRSFWHDWSAALKLQYPKLSLLGEVLDGDVTKVSFYQAGRARFDGVDSGIDTLFDFPLFYRVRESFGEGKALKPLAEQLARDHVYENPNQLVTFAGLHDVDRFMHLPGATPAGLKLAFTFLLTTRGIPLVYYGDEIALPGGGDPDNRRDFPGGWPEDSRNAFAREGRTPAEQEVWEHLQRLGRLRLELEPLRRGRLVQLAADEQTYSYARVSPGGRVIVAINNDTRTRHVEVPIKSLGLAEGTHLLDALSGPGASVANDSLTLELAPRSAAILH